MIENMSKRGHIQYIRKCILSINRIANKWALKKRIRRLDMLYFSKVPQGRSLTSKQNQEIDELFGKYMKIRHCSHLFYTQKTGVFHKEYIPDSIFSYIIDPYYNDWRMASYIDNKCYYPLLFQNVALPKMITYRLGNFWYDSNGKMIDFPKAIEMAMMAKECFIKKATNSWGGLGVFYFNIKQKNKT